MHVSDDVHQAYIVFTFVFNIVQAGAYRITYMIPSTVSDKIIEISTYCKIISETESHLSVNHNVEVMRSGNTTKIRNDVINKIAM